eukprot:CAMPEP_0113651188 /NCGR_PEP_ID=MMETSP0017_2-20120614/27274_1 /TAXON_ID=2856 /ORGANISM="Cylindrotheca closterium" /LENGTH=252 /DNA_ID=CAMNT_0000563821 /DNA_START=5 /DNA_END=763 /DNA_ORIENTATION=- /assembly_acc=CAM_ASM_000147
MKSIPSSLLCILIGVSLSTTSVVDAFTLNKHKPVASSINTIHTRSLPALHLNPSFLLSEAADGVVTDAAVAATAKTAEAIGAAIPESGGGGILDILKNIAVAITAVLFLGAGLTVVTASIIVPAAAKELETECKDLAPELWDEYMAKLEEGESIAQRPDLMQELGAKLQPLLDAKIERQFADQKAKGIDVSQDEQAWKAIDSLNDKIPKPDNSASIFGSGGQQDSNPAGIVTDQWGGDDDVVDAEVIKKTDS